MFGAILGDMIGAPYEFDRGKKTKEFPLFSRGSHFTDDSVMTVAVAEALIHSFGKSDEKVKQALVDSMQKWGQRYPHAGYGGMFRRWLKQKNPRPYGSFGNGSAMRVSSAGWLYETLEETQKYARLTAAVTHNHPEGIKGAEAVASAIFLARTGKPKEEIKEYIIREFGYDLSRTCNEIRPAYHHVETCQETVPEAITAFLEGNDFQDVIRTAVSLGGDCDTLTCIAGSIAEAFYGVPETLQIECRKRLTSDLLEVLQCFDEKRQTRSRAYHDPFLDGNEMITQAIDAYYEDSDRDHLADVLTAVRKRMHQDGHFVIPVQTGDKDESTFSFRLLQTKDGKFWNVLFTSLEEYEKGQPSRCLSNFMDTTLKACAGTESAGCIINPWGRPFLLTQDLIRVLLPAGEQVQPNEHKAEGTANEERLKAAVHAARILPDEENLVQLIRIMHDSLIWIPCNAILSDADFNNIVHKMEEAEAKDGVESFIGSKVTSQDGIRMVPDVLSNGENYFFPVFTTEEEMGDYGKNFSKI